ncbi:MAG: inverse autotransporter beta domain-containing protein [Candidatus Omnitrophica bacterium]|nr:inverse autotransporter beta domain-containing protein [Candidatus Omnitrophota bacterium]
MKKVTSLVIASFLIITSSSLQAEEKSAVEAKGKSRQQLLNAPTTAETKKDINLEWYVPDWLKRINYGVYLETDQKPRIYLETVQPLYQTLDKTHTIFIHDRISIQDERGTYSAGLGYRQLLFNEQLLAGINTFFDFQDLHKHYRTGLGLEALTKYLEGRINSYFALSPKRLVEEDSVSKIYEKAVNGGDVELGGPIPYLPWLKVFGSYYRYDYRKFKDKQGWKLRSELKPFKFITVNLETYDDNKGKHEYLMDTRFNLAFDSLSPKTILSAFGLNKEPFPDVDLKERTLDRVERNFNIEVEKWRETGGATFEVGGRW